MRVLIKPSLFLLAACLSTTVVAEVYKRILPDGTVEFTDVPPQENASPMDLPPLSTYPRSKASLTPRGENAEKVESGQIVYQELGISSPANDATIHDNTGSLSVTAAIKPALAEGHLLAIYVDGKKLQENTSGNFQLSNIDRGSHSLQLGILDQQGNILLRSQTISVHLRRASLLFPGR